LANIYQALALLQSTSGLSGSANRFAAENSTRAELIVVRLFLVCEKNENPIDAAV